MKLPYAHLNLRVNPFGEIPLDERATLAMVDTAAIASALEPERAAVQVLGPRGHGKTTHLLAVGAHHFPDAPYIHLAEGEPIPDIPEVPLLLLDEVQRMPRRRLRRLLDGPGRLLFGSHADHTPALRKAGRPETTIRLAGGLTAEPLVAMLRRRIEWARRGDGPVPCVPVETAQALIDRHGSDIRAIEHALYDVVQTMESIADVTL